MLREPLGGLPLAWAAPPSSPGPLPPPGTPGDPQLCPSQAVLADISWHSPSASVPGGPGGGDRRATGYRVTQQQEKRSTLPSPTPPGLPTPAATRMPSGAKARPWQHRHGKGLGLGHGSILNCPSSRRHSLPTPLPPGGATKLLGPTAMQVGRSSMPHIPPCPVPSPPILLSPSWPPSCSVMRNAAASQRLHAAWRSLPLKGKVFPDGFVSSRHRARRRGGEDGRKGGLMWCWGGEKMEKQTASLLLLALLREHPAHP